VENQITGKVTTVIDLPEIRLKRCVKELGNHRVEGKTAVEKQEKRMTELRRRVVRAPEKNRYGGTSQREKILEKSFFSLNQFSLCLNYL